MCIEEYLIDQNEDREEEEGCEYCGCSLYPHTVDETDEIEYVCRNPECSHRIQSA